MNEERVKFDIERAEYKIRQERANNCLKYIGAGLLIVTLIIVSVFIGIGAAKYVNCQSDKGNLSGAYSNWHATNCTLNDLIIAKKDKTECYSVTGYYNYSNTSIPKVLRDCKTLEWINQAEKSLPDFQIGSLYPCYYKDIEDSCKNDDGLQICKDYEVVFKLPNECSDNLGIYIGLSVGIPLIIIVLFFAIVMLSILIK